MHRKAVVLFVVAAFILAPATAGASNDAAFDKQWAMPLIGATDAWTTTTGEGVRIGIVDSGVDFAHEDLAANVVAHTKCVETNGDPAACTGSGQDDVGHGTHVSGIAAATKDNGLGVTGVAPGAELVVAKVGGAEGIAIPDVNAGVRWVVDHGAKVVNLSLGDAVFVRTALLGSGLNEGIEYAWSQGAVAVLASGNSNVLGLGVGSADYGDINALVVGASGPDDQVADYSSPTGNAKWALVAPGGAGGEEGIFSTYWTEGKQSQYDYQSGTSMAAPHVTGAVALLVALGLDAQAAVKTILATADHSVSCGPESPTCQGRLNVARAVAAASAAR